MYIKDSKSTYNNLQISWNSGHVIFTTKISGILMVNTLIHLLKIYELLLMIHMVPLNTNL